MQMEQTGCSEMSAHKLHTPWNCPEEGIQHLEHGENLKSRRNITSYNKKNKMHYFWNFFDKEL
jgi:hypothetical protein